MLKQLQPVALRHDVPEVPPLLRGHFGFWMGRAREDRRQGPEGSHHVVVCTWTGSSSPWIEVGENWFRTLPSHVEARMEYLNESMSYAHDPEIAPVWFQYQAAWEDLMNLLRDLHGKDTTEEEQKQIWLCHKEDDLIRELGLIPRLTEPVSLILHRKWLRLLNEQNDLAVQLLRVQEWF